MLCLCARPSAACFLASSGLWLSCENADVLIAVQDVKEKIETGTYNEPNEFLEDINLICDNAMTYALSPTTYTPLLCCR